MNIPNRASRNHSSRASRFVRESRHQAASGLSLAGKPNSSAANSGMLETKTAAAKTDFRKILERKSEFIFSAVIAATRKPCQSNQAVWPAIESSYCRDRRPESIDKGSVLTGAGEVIKS